MKNRLALLLSAALLAVAMLGFVGTASALTAEETLKQPPFPPTDVNLFSQGVYSEASATQPAPANADDEAALRGKLKTLLESRFGVGSTKARQGLATFDAASTKAIVSSPRLRAALVALKGTMGEPAINGVLDGTYSSASFGTTDPGAIAQVVDSPSGGLDIVYNNIYQHEDFRLLASTFAHEPLHRDTPSSNKEELIANSIDVLVYGQFVLETPSLATSGTELARFHNTELMARLNTRDANGKLRLFTSQGNIFPDGNFVPYFAAPYEPLGDSTPGNSVLKAEVKKVVPAKKVPRKVHFNDKTLILLDSYQRVFTADEVVQLAEILELDTSPPSTATAQRTQAAESSEPTPSWEEIFGAQ